MAIEFKLPELGENIESGDVVKVLVEEGQTIAANDGIVEIETEKAVVEIPCPHAGKVARLHVTKGQTVKVGQVLATIEPESESPSGPPEPHPAAPATTPAADHSRAKPPLEPPGSPAEQRAVTSNEPPTAIPAGPAARRVARELGVDLRAVVGSGLRGRITVEDVRAATAIASMAVSSAIRGAQAGAPATGAAGWTAASEAARTGAAGKTAAELLAPVEPPGDPGQDAFGPVRRQRMPRIRQTIAEQMSLSASTIPHVTNFDDADVTDLDALRQSVPPGYLGENVKLTLMPFAIKAVGMALRRHPILNASLETGTLEIVYKQYVNIGIAVDTPRGLVVPVLRGPDALPIPEIARQLAGIAQRAREAQFTIEETRGGTFTISNLGAVGGTYSTPIIRVPEAAILLLGRSRWLPVARHGQVVARLMLPLSLSYDHRLVDGAAAGRFLNDVIELLESPGRLLLV